MPLRSFLLPHLPAALLLLLSVFAGIFQAPLEPRWVLAGYAAVLVAALLGAPAAADPLRLGRGFRWLPWTFAALLLVLAWQGPFARAGRVGALLLPAWLLLPAAVARCWSTPPALRAGLGGVALVVAGVSGLALDGWWRLGTPGPSLPLGHHNLLAAWLVALLPLTASLWRQRGVLRALGGVATVGALIALFGTRSLAGSAALAAQISWLLWRRAAPSEKTAVEVPGTSREVPGTSGTARWRRVLIATVGLVALLAIPRLVQILGAGDSSVKARLAYAAAGWEGFTARPWLGWGAGSVPWTIGQAVEPRPGVLPAGEVIADLHALPLQWLYEFGLGGVTLIALIGWRFARRRGRDGGAGPVSRAASLGWVGLLVVSLGGLPLTVTALPFCAVLLAGVQLAGLERSKVDADPASSAGSADGPTVHRTRHHDPATLGAWIYLPLAALLLWPLARAQLEHQGARSAVDPERRQAGLWLASHLDPDFPLYTAQLAWFGDGRRGRAERALAAATATPGLAGLWLQAGRLGRDEERPWAREALERACALDPHGAIAPLLLAWAYPEDRQQAPRWAARALLAEPALLAAVSWRRRPWQLRRALELIDEHPAVDPAWRAAFRELASLPPADGTVRRLALRVDQHAATSLSLFAFRRAPWPTEAVEIEVFAERFQQSALGSAIATGRVSASALAAGCGLSRVDAFGQRPN